MNVFLSVDPLAEQFVGWTPYHYVHNNPINSIDPTGMAAETDYTLNKRTGDVKQVGETNDKPDRILQTNSRGEVKTNRDGSPKVAIDNISKGILLDGMNFKDESNIISIGGDGGASKEGVEQFALDLSDYVKKEIGGGYYSNDETKELTHMTIGAYNKNTYTKTQNKGVSAITKITNSVKEFNSFKLKGQFHTHPNENGRFIPSGQDLKGRNNLLKLVPDARFYIITHPESGSNNPQIIDYTNRNF